jgi:threonine dehydratase
MLVQFQDIRAAAKRLAGHVSESPCPPSIPLSEATGMKVFCKLEYLQRTGSFKERGARNALRLLSAEQQRRGVIAASAGNHALGVSYHAQLLGIPATVVMPRFAPLTKVVNCRRLGAEVVLEGQNINEARRRADELAAAKGLTYINGYDDPAIIAGQGTIGLELMEQVMELEKAVVEGAGAAPLAACLAGKLPELKGKRVVLPLTGGNIDLTTLDRVIGRGLATDGRLCRFTATISDRPGGLARFAGLIAEEGASVIDIAHDRAFGEEDISTVTVHCVVETRDAAHIAALYERLNREGFRVV